MASSETWPGEDWELASGLVWNAAGELICQLNLSNPAHQMAGPLIAAAPRLVTALGAAIEALQHAAVHIPPHSPADIAAARAVTLAYEAMRTARTTVEGKGAPTC